MGGINRNAIELGTAGIDDTCHIDYTGDGSGIYAARGCLDYTGYCFSEYTIIDKENFYNFSGHGNSELSGYGIGTGHLSCGY